MWFRFVLALAAIAMLSFVWMMFGPTGTAPTGQLAKPAIESGAGKS